MYLFSIFPTNLPAVYQGKINSVVFYSTEQNNQILNVSRIRCLCYCITENRGPHGTGIIDNNSSDVKLR
jgi:hypothetical protein